MKKPAFKRIDINTASITDLTNIKGIGPGLAQKIIDSRPYQTIDSLVKVSGISDAKLETLRAYFKVSPNKNQAAEPRNEPATIIPTDQPVAKLGETEAFVFFEDQNDRQDAALIILIGFLIGLLIVILRPSRD